MVRPRWRKVWRDLWLHRGRSALVVVAIAAGLAGAGTVLITWALVQRVTRVQYLASDPASATIRTGAVDSALLATIRAVPGVGAAEARRTVVGTVHGGGRWRPAWLFVAPEFAEVRIGALRLLSGTWPDDTTIVIERSSLAFAGLGVGDQALVAAGDRDPQPFTVSGTARDVGLAPGWMENVVYGFVSPEAVVRLGLAPGFDEIKLLVADRSLPRDEVRRIAYRAKAAIEATGRVVDDVEVPEPGEHVHAGQMNSLLYTQGAFGAMALVLCGFLVVNLIAAVLAGERRQIGVLKAIGARWDQLAAIYLLFALALGAAAALLGIPVALWLGRWYGTLKAELLNFDAAGIPVPVGVVVLQAAIGLLVPLVAAWVPVRRATRMPVAELLRGPGPARGETVVAVGGPGWSRLTLLGFRNAARRRVRVAMTLGVLAAGGGVYLGAANLEFAIGQSVDLMYARQGYNVSLRLADPAPAESIEAVARRVEGAGRVEAWGTARAEVPHADGTASDGFPVMAPPIPSAIVAQVPIAGRWLAAGDTANIVVSRAWQRLEPGVEVGDSVTVLLGGDRRRFEVMGLVDAGPAPVAYLPRATFTRGGHSVGSLMVATPLTDFATQIDLIQRLRTAFVEAGLPVATSLRVEEGRRAMEDHLVMVAEFLGLMGWVMMVVGGMGLAATMSLAVLERTREIGVLKAIGARHPTIFRLVLIEGLVIGLASWLVALPLSVPMSVTLAKAFSRIMIAVPIHYLPTPGGVATWLGIVVVVASAASAWPAWQAMRVETRRALGYE